MQVEIQYKYSTIPLHDQIVILNLHNIIIVKLQYCTVLYVLIEITWIAQYKLISHRQH